MMTTCFCPPELEGFALNSRVLEGSPSAIKVATVSTGLTKSEVTYCDFGWLGAVLVQGSFAADLVHLDERVAQTLDPVGLVHPDQTHAPGERLAAAPGDAAGHERVEDRPLAHAQARHHRHAEGGEDLGDVAAAGSPGHLAPELTLGVSG